LKTFELSDHHKINCQKGHDHCHSQISKSINSQLPLTFKINPNLILCDKIFDCDTIKIYFFKFVFSLSEAGFANLVVDIEVRVNDGVVSHFSIKIYACILVIGINAFVHLCGNEFCYFQKRNFLSLRVCKSDVLEAVEIVCVFFVHTED